MARLTESQLRQAVPRSKPYLLTDDNGLYAEVRPSGKIIFRVRYWVKGKERKLTIGPFPEFRLKEARERRDELKSMLARGIDPKRLEEYEESANRRKPPTFEEIAAEWLVRKQSELRSEKTRAQFTSRLEVYILPKLGNLLPDEINAAKILADVLRPIETQGKICTAHRIRALIGQIFRYAVATGRAERDPTRDLDGALSAINTSPHAAITDKREFAALLRGVEAYQGSKVVRFALKFQILTFVRPGELRGAVWNEIDIGDSTWKIPAERMKMKRPHLVPLARQSLTLLDQLKELTGEWDRYLFVAPRAFRGERPISDMTLLTALRTMGFARGQVTPHGFRRTASTILNESGRWNRDAIERQLAHTDADKIRATYNYAEYLNERREMMQWWADFLDELRES